ncbi:hypothetical protein BGZ96_010129 [Linnemannia gamsii]|uniref:Uncharacterized protein n=1 Tax=Linnemannia gamsii TaxID=64522 RepID=A0ABQ7JVB7_9FUNG|nr:hypothetical protein BGZ96_010129 [Linnemannia gamsii]
MAPPCASAKGKAKNRGLSVTTTNVTPATTNNKRKSAPIDPSIPPPPQKKVATVFSDDRERWLVKRLLDPAVYEPLQVSKSNPPLSNVNRKTKTQVHRELADEYNLHEEKRSGFVINGKSIKNKIGNIQSSFVNAHKLRYSSGFGSIPEVGWRKGVMASNKYYFDLEPKWGLAWSNGVSLSADSLNNLDDPVVADDPSRIRVTRLPDRGDDDMNGDEGWEVVREEVGGDTGESAIEDYLPHADDGDDYEEEEEEEERLVKNTQRQQCLKEQTPLITPAAPQVGQVDPEERSKSSEKSIKQQQDIRNALKDIRDAIDDIDDLGHYKIEAKKAVELRRLELNQQKQMAEIESSKAIKLAEINANKEVRLAAELAQSERYKVASQSQLQFYDLFCLVQQLAEMPRAKSPHPHRQAPPEEPNPPLSDYLPKK